MGSLRTKPANVRDDGVVRNDGVLRNDGEAELNLMPHSPAYGTAFPSLSTPRVAMDTPFTSLLYSYVV